MWKIALALVHDFVRSHARTSLQGSMSERIVDIHPTQDLGSIPSSAVCRRVPEGIIGSVLKGSSLLLLLCNMPTG